MATKRSKVYITVTVDEIKKLLIEKYADAAVSVRPTVSFGFNDNYVLTEATIEYETRESINEVTE